MKYLILFLLSLIFIACKSDDTPPPLFVKNTAVYQPINKAVTAPKIDGNPNDPAWNKTSWLPLNQLWLGEKQTENIRYKLAWTPDALYVLVKFDTYIPVINSGNNPLKNFKEQDRLLVYLDENNSGGTYANDHSAFAYQVLPNGFTLDFDNQGKTTSYNHISNRMMRNGKSTIWELKISVFDETYCDDQPNEAVKLTAGKKLGFALAFLKVNPEEEPDTILGSLEIPEDYEGRIEIDSGLFGTLQLEE
ncbi:MULTISPECIES: sugar-binding protein [unclassified Leeuwenhoekiella]|uniref:sugar-binding protein n=1 Tax=unclassified Leeuwenhoekiella TaxID=2615029 RepID=UPI000C5D61FC|nr:MULTISPECIES: sugar-binding protein [unclassified Leeuwenhoekiella]MAW94667.1 hypothetical protein [Leeuwenhoekiella sp.]MBA82090.1 hypothetical protein [Leeuwenhoekiella sp.]|tara:strand:- start:2977 stop:3720 length:744 start_codon:yes stop_codon:yes gene_type:complete